MDVFKDYAFEDVVRYGMALVVIATGLFAILYSIWGGFLMIISGGNEEKVKKAVNFIRYAVIGIIIMVVVLFAFPFIFGLLGIPYAEYTKPGAVFHAMQEISGKVFGYPVDPPIIDQAIIPGSGSLPSNFSQL